MAPPRPRLNPSRVKQERERVSVSIFSSPRSILFEWLFFSNQLVFFFFSFLLWDLFYRFCLPLPHGKIKELWRSFGAVLLLSFGSVRDLTLNVWIKTQKKSQLTKLPPKMAVCLFIFIIIFYIYFYLNSQGAIANQLVKQILLVIEHEAAHRQLFHVH